MEAEKHRPDIAVVLTDLDGPARFRPRWPVIWAVPAAYKAAVTPFGRKSRPELIRRWRISTLSCYCRVPDVTVGLSLTIM
jgi:hypothetical protein